MNFRVYKTKGLLTVGFGLAAAAIFSITFCAAFFIHPPALGLSKGNIYQIVLVGGIFVLLFLFRFLDALFLSVRLSGSTISLHRVFRRPICIAYREAVFTEKWAGKRLLSVEIVGVTGTAKQRKRIVLRSALRDFEHLVDIIQQCVVQRSEDMVEQYSLTESLPEGKTIKAHSSLLILIPLTSVFFVLCMIGLVEEAAKENWSECAAAAGLCAFCFVGLLFSVFYCLTFRFDTYGVTKANFVYRIHLPWDSIRSCGWTPSRKKFLVRSDKATINCTDLTVLSKALMDLLAAHFPEDGGGRRLCFPLIVQSSWFFRIVPALGFVGCVVAEVVFCGKLFLSVARDFELLTFVALCAVGIVLFGWKALTTTLRYEFDADIITEVRVCGKKRHAVSCLRNTQLNQSKMNQGEPQNELTLYFDAGKIVLNDMGIAYPAVLLHKELQRLYFHDDGKSTVSAAQEVHAFPIPRTSPSSVPHGVSLYWRGLGALALYSGAPLVLTVLGWFVLSGRDGT